MKLIYFHDFGSSAANGTIKTLRHLLPDFKVKAPNIPVNPTETFPFLKTLSQQE